MVQNCCQMFQTFAMEAPFGGRPAGAFTLKRYPATECWEIISDQCAIFVLGW